MRILGIDPGPNYFAWAIYDDVENEVEYWGMTDLQTGNWPSLRDIDGIAVERLVGRSHGIGQSVLLTAETVGVIRAIAEQQRIRIVFIARPTIASVVTGSSKSGDKEVNLAIQRLIPNCPPPGTRGFQGHHRAAIACAYVGVGRLKAQEIVA